MAVNMLLPGGVTVTGMIPDGLRKELGPQTRLLTPEIMAAPFIYLASSDAEGVTGERIVAVEFEQWLLNRDNKG